MSAVEEINELKKSVPLGDAEWNNVLGGVGSKNNKALELHVERIQWIVGQLARIYSADQTAIWLSTPNRLLHDKTPVDLLRIGEVRRVISAVKSTIDGAYI